MIDLSSITAVSGTEYWFEWDDVLAAPTRYSRVCRGRSGDGRDVAVKIVEVSEESNYSRWYNEARLAEREWEVASVLRKSPHKYLLLLDDYAQRENHYFMISQRAEKNLAELGALEDDDEVLSIIRMIASGFQELSVSGVLHRDVKPQNVLLHEGIWKLADFGIGKIEELQTKNTWEGTGTYEYWAPELFLGNPATLLTDYYALGCLAYEIRAGRLLYSGPDLRRQHETSEVPPIDGVSERLMTLLYRLLAKVPEERPQSASEIIKMTLNPALVDARAQRISQLRASFAENRFEESRQQKAKERAVLLAEQAMARLNGLIDGLNSRLGTYGVDIEVFERRDNSWLIRALDRQLLVVIFGGRENASDLVLMGTVNMAVEGTASAGPYVDANLVCEEVNGEPVWSIVRFTPNGIALSNERIGQPGGWRGLRPPDVWRAWRHRNKPVKPAILEKNPATVDQLLDIFIA